MPQRIREWVYAGFGINLISAFIAKLNSGYSLAEVLIEAKDLTSKQIQEHLIKRLYEFSGTSNINDDYTTMIVKFI